jgi:NTE family protein
MTATKKITPNTRGWWYRLVSWPGAPSSSNITFLSGLDHSPPSPRIGLALSSGGAKALADIGVIQVLEENHIPVHAVSGCSMGAYIGALWAAGHNGRQLEDLAGEPKSRGDLLRLADPAFPPSRGLLTGKKIKDHLARSLGNIRFDQLDKELFVVATNLNTYARTIFNEGSVLDAVHASIAIPGVFVPVKLNGETYVDGGASDPLPVSVLTRSGIEAVIAVSTLPSLREISIHRSRFQNPSSPPKNPLRRLGRRLNRGVNFFAEGNMINILRDSAMASQVRLAHHAAREADVVLTPSYPDGAWHDYLNYRRYIEIGRKSAEENLTAIQSLAASIAA